MALRLIVTSLLLALASAAHATMAVRLELDKLVDESALVLLATIDSKEARWDDGRAGIWTHHEITVNETLKGEHKNSREFATRGGVVGDRGQHVAGAGNFGKGEQYVLFLWRDDAGRYRLVGMVQGAFRVSESDGVKRARNSFAGLTVVDPETLKPVADRRSHDYELEDLKKRIAARLKDADGGAE